MRPKLKYKILTMFVITTFLMIFISYKLIERQYLKYGRLVNRYISFECNNDDICGGWADRLKGLFSTYAFSLITNRTFLIKITKNCDLKNILIPNKILWYSSQVPNSVSNKTLNYAWNYNLEIEFRNSTTILKEISNENLIIIKSGFMFSNVLSENRNFQERLNQLGYEPSKFKLAFQLRKWYQDLFRLNKRLQVKYDKLLKQMKPTVNSKLICAQLRMGDEGHVGESDLDMGSKFWNFINQTFLIDDKMNKFSIFITSDREYFKKDAELFFRNKRVFYTGNSSLHVERPSDSNQCENLEKVIFDFHLMQNCDIGVVSHSGFGILAMWNRPDPFKDLYVYTKKNQDELRQNYWNRKNLTFVKYGNLDDIYFL
ncbi:unnamed protein product [Brachionus calyciflorus]|uniref:L-Fucosyltransferase n=1 Tax=Brachionus calyciflorus TaxID=104777 RepID=A0A814DDZ2_9BILA|nr:unnamed protein product [Brachionus calyciflorus]